MKTTPEQINIVKGAIHVGVENNEPRPRQKRDKLIPQHQSISTLSIQCIKLQSGVLLAIKITST